MSCSLFLTWAFSVLFFTCALVFSAEENFLLIDSATDQIVLQLGPNVHERVSPASTFKIALGLMGYDSGILKDERTPVWDFQEGYVSHRESWKAPQTPFSWMKNSCVWYSQILAGELGMDTIKMYLKSLEYGNQDMSGGLTEAWLGSSLKISPEEQVKLIQRMLQGKLPIKPSSIQLTKALLFLEELEGGWKLFGKRGLCSSTEEIGWFVGWIEKEEHFFLFAYNIRGQQVDGGKMVPRVMELLSLVLKGPANAGPL
jgi:beta-lactamase class D